jgi:hypothetical protein
VQNEDGGFGASPGKDSSSSITAWVMLGLEAAGRNPLDVARPSSTPVDFLRSSLGEVRSSGDLARTIVALQGAGVDPRSFGGRNLVEALLKRRAADGSYEGWPGTTAYSAIALRGAGAGGVDKTISWLGSVQNDDGGWGDVPGQPSNADVTAAVMQAMPKTKAADRGLSYLRKHQRSDGGFGLGIAGGVNSQSTAWAIQGMIAVGADPASIASGGNSALDYLAARQSADGSYAYSASSNQTPVWVTGEVLVAAAGDALPISPPPREKKATTVRPSETVTPAPETGSVAPPPAELPPESLPRTEEGVAGIPPTASPGVPPATGGVPVVPGGTGGIATPEGGLETDPAQSTAPPPEPIAATGSAPSPWVPLGIGALATALAVVIPWFLGRRYAW